jgi:hypothetical protein
MAGKYCGSWWGSYYYVKKKLDILLENTTPLLKKHPNGPKKFWEKIVFFGVFIKHEIHYNRKSI